MLAFNPWPKHTETNNQSGEIRYGEEIRDETNQKKENILFLTEMNDLNVTIEGFK